MQGKDYTISIVRLIAFSMVVICHICNFYDNELAYWFNCGVQVFLIISGFLYGQRGIIQWKSFYRRNLPKIMIDYYIYLIIMIPIYLFVVRQSISVNDYVRFLFGIGTDIPGMGHLWYISTILVCYLITPFVSKIICSKTKWIQLLVFFAVTEALFILIPYFTGAWINGYVIAFIVGRHYKESDDKNNFLLRTMFVSVPCTVVVCGMEVLLKYILQYPMTGIIGRGANTIFHYGRIALAFVIFGVLMKFIHTCSIGLKGRKFLEITDKYSYDAYLVHLFFVLGPYSFFDGRVNAKDIVFGCVWLIIYILLAACLLRLISRNLECLFCNKKVED